MGNLQSFERPGQQLTSAEVDRLERRLRRIGRGRAEIARSDLRGEEGLGDNPFLERIFAISDTDNDGLLELQDVVNLLKQLSQLQTDEEARYRFAFRLFDTNGDGFIDRSELISVLQMTNKRGMTAAQLEQICDSAMRTWDKAGEGRLEFSAFRSLLSASSANLSL